MQKIAIGCDHGAVDLKDAVVKFLKEKGYPVSDCGTFGYESVDYPDFAEKVCKEVLAKQADRGIVICSTGIGISISANKIPGIRCALLTDVYSAKLTREHNDANVMALGAKVTGEGLALMIVETFLSTDFSNIERHQRRIDKISQIEKNYK